MHYTHVVHVEYMLYTYICLQYTGTHINLIFLYGRLIYIQVFTDLVQSYISEEGGYIGLDFLSNHLKQMIEVIARARRYLHGPDPTAIALTKETALLLLDQLERVISPSQFIEVTMQVQQRLDKNKADKRMKEKTEYVNNPRVYAMRKVRVCICLCYM